MELEKLKKEIPYKWRVQSFSKQKPLATCVAYIDSRDAQKLLDEVCGPENWQDDYKIIDGKLFGGIGIYVNNQWIWKWDCGTESDTEKEKGQASDAFKRAGVKWGIGRFLYDLPIQYVDASANKEANNYPQVVDKSGQRVYDITKFINDRMSKPETTAKPSKTEPKPKAPKVEDLHLEFMDLYSQLAELTDDKSVAPYHPDKWKGKYPKEADLISAYQYSISTLKDKIQKTKEQHQLA